MEVKATSDELAARQFSKLKSLLKKYRHFKTMQTGLLQLSELASKVTDMPSFYQALTPVIESLFITDSFHISLLNPQRQLELAYCQNQEDARLIDQIDSSQWQQSLTGIVFQNEEPMHCSSAERMALAKAGKIILYGSSCVDWLGVPLRRGHQVIGVIALQSYNNKLYFDDRDCQLLEFIAEHLVTAIDRVRGRELLEQKIRHRTQKLTEANLRLQKEIAERQKAVKLHKALLAISELTATTDDINVFYQTIHGQIKTLLPAKNLYIALLNTATSMVDFTYYHDEKIEHPKPRKFANGLTELALRTGKPLLISGGIVNTLEEDGSIQKQAFTMKYPLERLPRAWLGAPLIDRGKAIGVLAIQHYQDDSAYQLEDLEIIRFVSQHIATAILRKQVQDNIQRSKHELEVIVNQRTEQLQASNLNLAYAN